MFRRKMRHPTRYQTFCKYTQGLFLIQSTVKRNKIFHWLILSYILLVFVHVIKPFKFQDSSNSKTHSKSKTHTNFRIHPDSKINSNSNTHQLSGSGIIVDANSKWAPNVHLTDSIYISNFQYSSEDSFLKAFWSLS